MGVDKNSHKKLKDKNPLQEQNQRILQIFGVLANKRTFLRNILILDALSDNPESYLAKKSIKRILSEKLDDKELNLIGDDLRRLTSGNLVHKRGNRYHLTEIGVITVATIAKLRQELSQHLLQQFTRAMLLHAVYEGKGLQIHSDKHVRQIGYLIRETIQNLVEQDRILEWTVYLDRFNEILETLSAFCENYKDEPEIYQQLFHIKSEIELEFARYHDAAQEAFSNHVSMIQAGFDPIKIKESARILSEQQLKALELSLNPLLGEKAPVENALLWEHMLEDERAQNNRFNHLVIQNPQIKTDSVSEEEVEKVLDIYQQYYQVQGKLFEQKMEKDSPLLISDLIEELGKNWSIVAKLIANIPSIEQEFKISAVPVKKLIQIKKGKVTDGLIYCSKGEENSYGD